MKLLLDTNVLVAGLVELHPRHEEAWLWLDRAQGDEVEGFVSLHTLAEAYSVLTTLPLAPRIRPDQAEAILNSTSPWLQTVGLEVRDYQAALSRMVRLNLPGGGIYDVLHAQAALKVGVDGLLTLNPKHFSRLGDDIAALVRVL
ncbi:MAG: PIN domain-containing protein [Deinococcota bacterium]|jgi:predicted nucleic acid-binding protein|nr:PIN domain-containing protein [Deinococcota bacterium]